MHVILENLSAIRLREAEGWRQTAQQARDHGDGQGERQHGRIDADFLHPRERKLNAQVDTGERGGKRSQQVRSAKCDQASCRAAQERQENALGEKLTDHPAATSAESQAYPYLALSG